MDKAFKGLQPEGLWKHFAALTRIPRCSKNEAAAAAYVLAEAKRLGLKVKQDGAGNVIVWKPASHKSKKGPAVVIQGHLDMVCEKNEGTKLDFCKDPIPVVRDGDLIKTLGTTLGADNGIGVAAGLALMEATDVKHGPLEFLFTIDEETGLTGAFKLEQGLLKGTRLLNLDSEEEGALYIGCAGGLDTVATKRVRQVRAKAGAKLFRLKACGLKGGHSGLDISQGRGNALKLIARVLLRLTREFDLELASLDGGSKRNAIPREAFALVSVNPAQVEAIGQVLAQMQADVRSELGSADPEFTLLFEPQDALPERVVEPGEALALLRFLYACPHGMLAMTPDMPGLVQTSTNLAIVETTNEIVKVSLSHRSSVESAKKDVGAMVAAYCEMNGFLVEQSSGYPGWKPNLGSALLQTAIRVHEEEFSSRPEIKAIHAGLECGIIGERYPGMDMISFGPNIMGAHSPDERVSISSTGNFWKFLVALIESL